MFWHDEHEDLCTSVKTPVPANWKVGLTKTWAGSAFLYAIVALADGSLGFGDVATLVAFGSQAAYHSSLQSEADLVKNQLTLGQGISDRKLATVEMLESR